MTIDLGDLTAFVFVAEAPKALALLLLALRVTLGV